MSAFTPMLAGNLCSFVAACFTLMSAWSRDRKRIYLYQAAQCFILAIANVFFASVSGTTTFLLCAARNCLVAWDRFTPRRCALFVASVAALGIRAGPGAVGSGGLCGLSCLLFLVFLLSQFSVQEIVHTLLHFVAYVVFCSVLGTLSKPFQKALSVCARARERDSGKE